MYQAGNHLIRGIVKRMWSHLIRYHFIKRQKKFQAFFIQQRAPNNPTSAFRLWIFIFTKFEKFVSVTRIIASRTNATLNNEQL